MKRVVFVTGLLAVLAAVSAVSILQSARDYGRAMEVVRGFRLELSDLELTDDDHPEVAVEYLVANNSAVNLDLDALRFSLYLNDQFIGSNYDPFALRIVSGHQEETLRFVLPIEPFYQQYLDRAAESDSYSWSIRGRYKLLLPFKEKAIWLNLRGRWNDS